MRNNLLFLFTFLVCLFSLLQANVKQKQIDFKNLRNIKQEESAAQQQYRQTHEKFMAIHDNPNSSPEEKDTIKKNFKTDTRNLARIRGQRINFERLIKVRYPEHSKPTPEMA